MAQNLMADPVWRDAVTEDSSEYYPLNYEKRGQRMATLEAWRWEM